MQICILLLVYFLCCVVSSAQPYGCLLPVHVRTQQNRRENPRTEGLPTSPHTNKSAGKSGTLFLTGPTSSHGQVRDVQGDRKAPVVAQPQKPRHKTSTSKLGVRTTALLLCSTRLNLSYLLHSTLASGKPYLLVYLDLALTGFWREASTARSNFISSAT